MPNMGGPLQVRSTGCVNRNEYISMKIFSLDYNSVIAVLTIEFVYEMLSYGDVREGNNIVAGLNS